MPLPQLTAHHPFILPTQLLLYSYNTFSSIFLALSTITYMDKLKKSQILKLFPIAALLIITPFLSTSIRSTYLYFIANILFILVGAEAGLVSFFLKPPENKKRASSAPKPDFYSPHNSPDKTAADQEVDSYGTNNSPDNVVKKCPSSKILCEVKELKKSPSRPSIFFIGGGETEQVSEENVDKGEEIGEELFQKAETFIGNFYKQLKMQREESWKKLHDLYQKAF